MTTVARFLLDAVTSNDDERLRGPSSRALRGAVSATKSTAQTEDAELLARRHTGDATAVETVVQMHLALLLRVARRHGLDAASAEDLVQDVLARHWERRATLQITTTIRAYLIAMIRNAVVSQFRHARVEHDSAALFAAASESPTAVVFSSPEQALEDAELAQALTAALDARQRRDGQSV